MDALQADEVWWLVSPGNPLKAETSDMAPLRTRLNSAQRMARRSRIKATAIEATLGTKYTVDTLNTLVRRYPNRRFIWLMGGDNLAQFHRWKDWRKIAAIMPIAVIARPGYEGIARASRAMGWFRGRVRLADQAQHWTRWRPPALVLLRFRPDKTSATALRRDHPDWDKSFSQTKIRDSITHRLID
jgi:nicotinate-nucleotide adenylyltransferase